MVYFSSYKEKEHDRPESLKFGFLLTHLCKCNMISILGSESMHEAPLVSFNLNIKVGNAAGDPSRYPAPLPKITLAPAASLAPSRPTFSVGDNLGFFLKKSLFNRLKLNLKNKIKYKFEKSEKRKIK